MGVMLRRALSTVAVVLLAAGCSSVGPKTIRNDNFNYSEAIRESWKEQMLLNMVGLRYAEAPIFLRATSVINQYSIDGRVSASTPPYEGAGPSAPPLGLSGGYADRPTITYTPMTGAEFTRSVMTPIPPETIMSMIQAGWRADILFRLAVRSVNGIGSDSVEGQAGDPTHFYEMVLLMQKLQSSGDLSFRIRRRSANDVAVIMIKAPESPETRVSRERLGDILGLDPDLSEYRLVFGLHAASGAEIAMLTRSILEMLLELSMWIDVPAEHVAAGWTHESYDSEAMTDLGFEPMLRINSSTEKPDDAFVVVEYEGVWFWIDDGDFVSKRTLSFMQIMFSLAESGTVQTAPMVTVQAGG
jgi:hypothetical protein